MVTPKKEERQALCSKCMVAVPEADTHVIPHYNDTLRMYVTTFRCGNCFFGSIGATRRRLLADAEDDLRTCADFFVRHGIRHPEFDPACDLETTRAKCVELVDRIKSGDLKIKLGKSIPIKLPKPGEAWGGLADLF